MNKYNRYTIGPLGTFVPSQNQLVITNKYTKHINVFYFRYIKLILNTLDEIDIYINIHYIFNIDTQIDEIMEHKYKLFIRNGPNLNDVRTFTSFF